jgi:type IV secretory pathway VirB10-like protein
VERAHQRNITAAAAVVTAEAAAVEAAAVEAAAVGAAAVEAAAVEAAAAKSISLPPGDEGPDQQQTPDDLGLGPLQSSHGASMCVPSRYPIPFPPPGAPPPPPPPPQKHNPPSHPIPSHTRRVGWSATCKKADDATTCSGTCTS